MDSRCLTLGVEQLESGAFIWVITETDADSVRTEIAASLETYASPSQALAAGARVMQQANAP